ncbi:MAG: hypothetical protein ACRD3Q_01460 [Terriglobales bacterium]
MATVLKGIGALVVALVVWMVVATVIHRMMCVVWPAYAVATPLLNFTLPMKVARLSLGALCTLIAGAAARRLSSLRWLPFALGCALLVLFLPEHYKLWSRFPAWYHLTFLGSLIPLALLGGRLPSARQTREAHHAEEVRAATR